MNYFQIKILLLSFIVTVVLGVVIIPILKKLKVGQIEREDGPSSHLKKQGTPTMGRNYNNYSYDNITRISLYKLF